MSDKVWTHKGIAITFDTDRAVFGATIRGKYLRAPSLDALKKKIDAESKFEPFPCYIEMQGWGWKEGLLGVAAFHNGTHRGQRALIMAMATGIEKAAGSRISAAPEYRVEYIDSRGKKQCGSERCVMPQTDEALAAWKLHWETSEKFEQAEADLKKSNAEKLSPLHAAMPWRRASEEG